METNTIISLINCALLECDNLVAKGFYFDEKEPIVSTKKGLILLKEELLYNPKKINLRVLRRMHDIGMSSYKEFENTPLEDAILNIVNQLGKEIPYYKNLEPLRMDFNKENPL